MVIRFSSKSLTTIAILSACFLPQFSALQAQTPSKAKTKITVFGGGGAVGSYFLFKALEHSDNEVSLVGREESRHLKVIEEKGLKIETSEGIKNISQNSFPNLHYIGSEPSKLSEQDFIVVSVKQPDFDEALSKKIKSIMAPHATIIIIGNGVPYAFVEGLPSSKPFLKSVDPTGKITDNLKKAKTIFLHPIIAAEKTDLGTIKISRPLDKISVTFSRFSSNVTEEDLKQAAGLFNPDQKTNDSDNLSKKDLQWNISKETSHKFILEKLQFSLAINTLSALLEKPIDVVFDDPETQSFIKYCVDIINAIAKESGIAKLRTYEQFKAIKLTKGHYSSFYKDIQEGKKPELDAIVSATIELAEDINAHNRNSDINVASLYALKELLLQKMNEKKNPRCLTKVEILKKLTVTPESYSNISPKTR